MLGREQLRAQRRRRASLVRGDVRSAHHSEALPSLSFMLTLTPGLITGGAVAGPRLPRACPAP